MDLRVGLIGYRLGGAAFHAPFIATTPGLHLDAIVTGNPERRQQAARDHPGVRLFDRADQLWAPGARIDLVVVASPNRTHVPFGVAALQAGLPVVIDKPFAPSIAEGERLIEEAERRRLMLCPYHNRRWDGDFLTLRALVSDNALGAVRRFESRFERWRPQLRGDWRDSRAPEEAGGLLYDLGTHVIDQALVAFGPAAPLYAELDCRRPGSQVEDDVFVALQHESGVRSHLWVSAVAASPGARFRVLGASGAYTKHGLDPQEALLRDGVRPDAAGFGEEPQERWGTLSLAEETRPVATHRGHYGQFYAGVAAALRDGAPPPVDARDALRTVSLIERIRKQWGRA
ncbi:MAG: Gfo/Idh/MocA family oxidoreductase [Bacteroidales bacterium]